MRALFLFGSFVAGVVLGILLSIFTGDVLNVRSWNADWFQAVFSLLAVSVALTLPFYQDKKRRAEEVKSKEEQETAFLICMHHQLLLLRAYCETAGKAFSNEDGVCLQNLAYKSKSITPEFLLDQNNDLMPLYSKVSPLYQGYLAICISSARELMADIEGLTKFYVDDQLDNTAYFGELVKRSSVGFRNKCVGNANAGYEYSDLLVNLAVSRFPDVKRRFG